jgi:hypothetical protein
VAKKLEGATVQIKSTFISLGLVLALSQRANAQVPDMSSKPFIQAVIVVMMFDHFATKCEQTGSFSTSDAAQVEAWKTTNGIAQIRTRMRELESDAAQKQKLDQAQTLVTTKFAGLNIDPCTAALAMTKRPEAQLAATFPQLLGTSSPPSKTRKVVEKPPSRKPTVVASQGQTKLLSQIESFGFDTRMTMGVGGFLGLDVYPVVLFRNGEALTDVTGLSFSGGLDAHKQANPGDWTRWRRSGGKLQLEGKKGWEALAFQATYSQLPNNFKLEGLFRSLSGTGNIAMGGTQMVAAWSEYRFTTSGQVVRGNGAGGSGEAGDVSVVTNSIAPNRRGRYSIDGLTLRITYDDGSSENRILISNPKDPKSAIWLDGVGYSRRK